MQVSRNRTCKDCPKNGILEYFIVSCNVSEKRAASIFRVTGISVCGCWSDEKKELCRACRYFKECGQSDLWKEERTDLDVELFCWWQLCSSVDYQMFMPVIISQSDLWTCKSHLQNAKCHCWRGVFYMSQKYIFRMGDIQGDSYTESRSISEDIQSDSYTETRIFLPVIIERMMGRWWNLLLRHCLFMLGICLSNVRQFQQTLCRERVTKW